MQCEQYINRWIERPQNTNILQNFYCLHWNMLQLIYKPPIPVATRSKVWVWGNLLAMIVGSIPTWCLSLVSVVCCQVQVSVTSWSLVQGVLLSVLCHCMWCRILKNEEIMVPIGLHYHRKKQLSLFVYKINDSCSSKYMLWTYILQKHLRASIITRNV